jgi:hypothetical protein
MLSKIKSLVLSSTCSFSWQRPHAFSANTRNGHEVGTYHQETSNQGTIVFYLSLGATLEATSIISTRPYLFVYIDYPFSNLLEDAFAEAKVKFSSTLSQDQQKIGFVNSKNSLEDVRAVVLQSMVNYESRKTSSQARKWLQSFSQRVKFYGDILDVFVQHHPEYVSLVWGAMKFLFTVGLSPFC